MFKDYYVNPGWWMMAMLILAKYKSNSAPDDYQEFVEEFIGFILIPMYLSDKEKRILEND